MNKLLIVLITIAVFGLGSIVWWKNGVAPVDKKNTSQKTFVIRKNEGVREIANSLKRENFIKDPIVFFLLVEKLGLDKKIQAGDHRLSQTMSAAEIARNLTLATNDVWITIPEGFRAQEIADIFQRNIKSFNNSWRKILEENEGYLFPDTYLLPKTSNLSLILPILKNNFENKFVDIDKNKRSDLDRDTIVKVASLVEREAKLSADRPLVASVIYNRLKIGMKLDIDATVQYVLGFQENEKRWWKKNLTHDDLKISSPYNTYRNPGLPIAPISNPGLDALKASANPAQTNYLYYISDKKGVNHYAETIQEHNANIQKYGVE